MRCGYNQYGLIKIPIKKACTGYFLRWYYNGWHYYFFLPGTLTINTDGEKYRTIGTRKIAMNSGQITRGQSDAIRTIAYTREVYLLTSVGWMNIRIEPGTLNIYDSRITGGEIEFVAIIGSREISLTGYSPVAEIPVVPSSTSYCEVVIGTQIWMCKNWDSNFPGSKVYDNDEANRAIYGGLYTFNQIMSPGFCPDGWHIPTLAEWGVLIVFAGGGAIAGGHLKEVGTTHWDAPNTGAVDTYGFTARPTGYFATTDFLQQNIHGFYWTGDSVNEDMSYVKLLSYNDDNISNQNMPKSFYFGVRLIKDIMVSYTNINSLVTGWSDMTGWDSFISVGRNITTAINSAASSEYVQSNNMAVIPGQYLEFMLNVTINSGNNPQFYIWDSTHGIVIVNRVLTNGVNMIYLIIPSGCNVIYMNLVNVINFSPPSLAVDFEITMP